MIGIIGAMVEEVETLKSRMESKEELAFLGFSLIEITKGMIDHQEIVVAKSGIGKANAAMVATIMIEKYQCDLIINTGIAGGICGVQPKDIVLGEKVMYHDVDCTAFQYAYGQIPQMPKYFLPQTLYLAKIKKNLQNLKMDYKEGTIYSGDSFITSKKQLSQVNLAPVSVADMESGAIAQVCTSFGVDFIAMKYVSDLVDDPKQISNYTEFEKEMARRSAAICLQIVQNNL